MAKNSTKGIADVASVVDSKADSIAQTLMSELQQANESLGSTVENSAAAGVRTAAGEIVGESVVKANLNLMDYDPVKSQGVGNKGAALLGSDDFKKFISAVDKNTRLQDEIKSNQENKRIKKENKLSDNDVRLISGMEKAVRKYEYAERKKTGIENLPNVNIHDTDQMAAAVNEMAYGLDAFAELYNSLTDAGKRFVRGTQSSFRIPKAIKFNKDTNTAMTPWNNPKMKVESYDDYISAEYTKWARPIQSQVSRGKIKISDKKIAKNSKRYLDENRGIVSKAVSADELFARTLQSGKANVNTVMNYHDALARHAEELTNLSETERIKLDRLTDELMFNDPSGNYTDIKRALNVKGSGLVSKTAERRGLEQQPNGEENQGKWFKRVSLDVSATGSDAYKQFNSLIGNFNKQILSSFNNVTDEATLAVKNQLINLMTSLRNEVGQGKIDIPNALTTMRDEMVNIEGLSSQVKGSYRAEIKNIMESIGVKGATPTNVDSDIEKAELSYNTAVQEAEAEALVRQEAERIAAAEEKARLEAEEALRLAKEQTEAAEAAAKAALEKAEAEKAARLEAEAALKAAEQTSKASARQVSASDTLTNGKFLVNTDHKVDVSKYKSWFGEGSPYSQYVSIDTDNEPVRMSTDKQMDRFARGWQKKIFSDTKNLKAKQSSKDTTKAEEQETQSHQENAQAIEQELISVEKLANGKQKLKLNRSVSNNYKDLYAHDGTLPYFEYSGKKSKVRYEDNIGKLRIPGDLTSPLKVVVPQVEQDKAKNSIKQNKEVQTTVKQKTPEQTSKQQIEAEKQVADEAARLAAEKAKAVQLTEQQIQVSQKQVESEKASTQIVAEKFQYESQLSDFYRRLQKESEAEINRQRELQNIIQSEQSSGMKLARSKDLVKYNLSQWNKYSNLKEYLPELIPSDFHGSNMYKQIQDFISGWVWDSFEDYSKSARNLRNMQSRLNSSENVNSASNSKSPSLPLQPWQPNLKSPKIKSVVSGRPDYKIDKFNVSNGKLKTVGHRMHVRGGQERDPYGVYTTITRNWGLEVGSDNKYHLKRGSNLREEENISGRAKAQVKDETARVKAETAEVEKLTKTYDSLMSIMEKVVALRNEWSVAESKGDKVAQSKIEERINTHTKEFNDLEQSINSLPISDHGRYQNLRNKAFGNYTSEIGVGYQDKRDRSRTANLQIEAQEIKELKGLYSELTSVVKQYLGVKDKSSLQAQNLLGQVNSAKSAIDNRQQYLLKYADLNKEQIGVVGKSALEDINSVIQAAGNKEIQPYLDKINELEASMSKLGSAASHLKPQLQSVKDSLISSSKLPQGLSINNVGQWLGDVRQNAQRQTNELSLGYYKAELSNLQSITGVSSEADTAIKQLETDISNLNALLNKPTEGLSIEQLNMQAKEVSSQIKIIDKQLAAAQKLTKVGGTPWQGIVKDGTSLFAPGLVENIYQAKQAMKSYAETLGYTIQSQLKIDSGNNKLVGSFKSLGGEIGRINAQWDAQNKSLNILGTKIEQQGPIISGWHPNFKSPKLKSYSSSGIPDYRIDKFEGKKGYLMTEGHRMHYRDGSGLDPYGKYTRTTRKWGVVPGDKEGSWRLAHIGDTKVVEDIAGRQKAQAKDRANAINGQVKGVAQSEADALKQIKTAYDDINKLYGKYLTAKDRGNFTTLSDISNKINSHQYSIGDNVQKLSLESSKNKYNELSQLSNDNIVARIWDNGTKAAQKHIQTIDSFEKELLSADMLSNKMANQLDTARSTIYKSIENKPNQIASTKDVDNYIDNIQNAGLSARKGVYTAQLSELQSISGVSEQATFHINELATRIQSFESVLSKMSTTKTTSEFERLKVQAESLSSEIDKLSSKAIDATGAKGYIWTGAEGLNKNTQFGPGQVQNINDATKALKAFAEQNNYAMQTSLKVNRATNTLVGTYKSVGGQLATVTAQFNASQKSLNIVNSQMGQQRSLFSELAGSFGNFFKMYFTTFTVVPRVMQSVKSGYEEFANYNKTLLNISYTMDLTKSQLTGLGESALASARDLGMAVDDMEKIYQVYSNMNITTEQLAQEAKPTAVLANLSGEDASEAADQIQAVLQQFKLLEGDDSPENFAKQSEHIVDVMDLISARLSLDYS